MPALRHDGNPRVSLPARPAKPTVIPSKSTGSVFSRLDFPTQRDFDGDGVPRPGREPEGGTPAPRRLLRDRLVKDGERTYHAYSADELIEIDSLAHHGRPGMPY